MNKTRKAHRIAPRSLSLAIFAMVGIAHAQTEVVPRVEVTGSLIKRPADEGALPVSSIRAEELQARGHTELKDFMLELPQASSLGTFAGTAGPMTSLRGFGPMRTLTLLNGRRLAKEPLTNQYVSVSVMPRMAMARTDILRDGASSAYGSDAVAGVQAFYTHNNYRGVNIKLEALEPRRAGGGDYQSIGAIGGIGDLGTQGWNVYAAFEHQRRKILLREERPELNAGLAELGIATLPGLGANATPANFTDPTNPVTANRTLRWNPYFASGCLSPFSEPSTSGGRQTCFLDANDTYTAFGNGNEITTLYAKGTMRLAGGQTVSLEGNFARYEVLQNNAATPVTVRLESTHPYYPGNGIVPAVVAANLNGRPIDALWSIADAGPRQREDRHTNNRIVLNLEGEFASWNYQLGLNHGWSERDTRAGSGWMSVNGIASVRGTATTLFLDPRLNPFGLQNAAGLAALSGASIAGQTFRLHKGTNTSIDLTMNRSLFALKGGDALLAAGAELRRDGWEAVGLASNDPLASLNNQINILGGDAQAAGAGSATSNEINRNITSAFAELELPLLKTLSINGALRVDHYKDLSETTINPKLALRWQPHRQVVARASANTGFRAPSLPEIYSKETERTALATFDDPTLCPTINGVRVPASGYTAAQVCQLTLRNQITKVPSNAQVSPEESRSFTMGAAFEPARGYSISLDYWQTEIKDVIGNRSITFILNNPQLYTGLFRREADGTLSTDALINIATNLGKIRAAGWDLSASAQFPVSRGRMTLSLDGAYLTRWEASSPEVAGGAWVSALGQYNDVVPINPNAGLSNATRGLNHRWRHTASVAYRHGAWNVQLSQRYQSSIRDQNLAARTGPGTTGPRNVAAYEQWNLNTGWQVNKWLKLSFAISNLLDKEPPLTNHNGYLGYLTSSVDVLGRAYRFTADMKF
jgi:iron complex outermembrane recepter protein